MPSLCCHLLGHQTAREEHDDLRLAGREPGRAIQPRRLAPGSLDDSGHRVGIEMATVGLGGQNFRGPLRDECVTVRARFAHRVERVGGGEQPRRHRQLRGGRAAVVAGAVEVLMVGSGDRCERGEEPRPGEHTFGVVGMQAHLLPLVSGQRTTLPPDACVHGDTTKIVHETRPQHVPHAARRDPTALRGRGGELGYPRRVPGQVRRDEVRETPHCSESAIDLVVVEHQRRPGLHGQHFLPGRGGLLEGEDLAGLLREASTHVGIEGMAGPHPDE